MWSFFKATLLGLGVVVVLGQPHSRAGSGVVAFIRRLPGQIAGKIS